MTDEKILIEPDGWLWFEPDGKRGAVTIFTRADDAWSDCLWENRDTLGELNPREFAETLGYSVKPIGIVSLLEKQLVWEFNQQFAAHIRKAIIGIEMGEGKIVPIEDVKL